MATILVIDDEEPIRALLRIALEGAGHEVLEASNGRLGLAQYRARSADLIITDIVMPEIDRLEMMLDLTRNFRNVKVIAISAGLEGEAPLHVAKMLGARQTIQKPLDMEKLLSAVRYELAHQRQDGLLTDNAPVLRTTHDKYKRALADVILPDGMNLNQELVKQGWCWWYRKDAPGDTVLDGLEKEASEGGPSLRDTPEPAGQHGFTQPECSAL